MMFSFLSWLSVILKFLFVDVKQLFRSAGPPLLKRGRSLQYGLDKVASELINTTSNEYPLKIFCVFTLNYLYLSIPGLFFDNYSDVCFAKMYSMINLVALTLI